MNVLTLTRIHEDDRTIGRLVYGSLKWCALELPWVNNEVGKSCIPCGVYECEQYYSAKFERTCISVKNVIGRTGIAMHPGNYTRQIEGCITELRDNSKSAARIEGMRTMPETDRDESDDKSPGL